MKTVDINGWLICFDPKTHRYSDINGKIPGVSEILTSRTKKYYSKDSSARDRGTRIHEATALMDTVGLSTLDFDDVAIHPHLTAWQNWQYESKATILAVEKITGHQDLRYAGTLDRVVCMQGLMVADLKTGKHEKWHRLQLAAYAVALGWETGVTPMGGIAVYTKPTGKYVTKPYQGSEWDESLLEWQEIAKEYKEIYT